MENGDSGGGGGGILRELQDLGEKFKVDDQDEQYISPYAHLEKATVLQEARYVTLHRCALFYLIFI
jgi:hypothetical protein